MSLTALPDLLVTGPLEVLYGGLFDTLAEDLGSPGLGILAFSLVLNAVVLPLYIQMERAGREAKARRAEMDKEIDRIKRHFKGRERYFYVTTIHRHYGYRPISVVFGSLDLYLQVFLFVTVYHWLAGVETIRGVAFAGIPDLAQPDGLLAGVNLLPLLMTAANVASAAAYSADRTRLRNAVLLALLFLVLLYSAPSALVLYWTMNNVVSLLRNLVARALERRHPDLGARLAAAAEAP